MDQPVINIITRVSRPNYFKLCYDSIHNQTYKNFNHIVTYENQSIYDAIKEYKNTTLLKVPDKRKIPGLEVCWNHNASSEGYLNPNHDFLDYRALDRGEDHQNNIYTKEHHEITPIVVKANLNDGYSHHHPGTITWREYATHAPYNWYLKIAEKALKPGWVLYVDDDDQLFESTTLEKLVDIISNHNEDTLHINQFIYPNGDLIPDARRCILYQAGYPFIHRQVSGVCLLFHTKYADYTYWDEWSSADYRTAISLREAIPNLNITNLVAIKLTKGTHGGSREDLK